MKPLDDTASTSHGVQPSAAAVRRATPVGGTRAGATSVGPSRGRAFYALFISVLVLGFFLRVWRLGHQSYWCDEVATIMRISGDFNAVINTLQGQGFTPGWYMLLWSWVWLLEHVLKVHGAAAFDPAVLRLPGAMLGCLTLPLMYLLARQFTDRKVSLVVLLLAAVNPFLVYYSRDLKMYPAVICFTLANVVCFLLWQRSDLSKRRRAAAAVAWLLTGILMTGVQSIAWFVIGSELLWLLCRRRYRWWDMPLFVLGMATAAVLPIWWYTHKTNWVKAFAHHHGGLSWASWYMHCTVRDFVSIPSEQLFGFLYPIWPPTNRIIGWFNAPGDFRQHLATRSLAWVAHAEVITIFAAGIILLAGFIPWPRRHQRCEVQCVDRVGRWWHLALWIGLAYLISLLSGLPRSNPLSIFPHRVIWEPRYTCFVAPALTLWLGLALVRLPWRALRGFLLLAVVLVMLASSFTNQLTYRWMPWHAVFATARRYAPPVPAGRQTIIAATGFCLSPWTGLQIDYNVRPWLGRAPDPHWHRKVPWLYIVWNRQVNTWKAFIQTAASKPVMQSIVVADVHPDVPTGFFTTANISALLGPKWRLVGEHRFNWYYAWRFYLFQPWRVRVWNRVPVPPPAPPGNIKPTPAPK